MPSALKLTFLGIAGLLIATSTAGATIIRQTDFDYHLATDLGDDTYPGEIIIPYDYEDPKGAIGAGASIQFDSTPAITPWQSVKLRVNDETRSLSPVVETNLSKIVVRFDARVQGLATGVTTVNGQIGLNNLIATDSFALQSVVFTPDWTSYEFTLDQFAFPVAFNTSKLESPLAYHFELLDVLPAFGFDDNNKLAVDNIQIAEVPEPAGLAVAGLAGLAMLTRRRR